MKPLSTYNSLEKYLFELIYSTFPIYEHKIASREGECARTIDMLNGNNFNIWRLQLEMGWLLQNVGTL